MNLPRAVALFGYKAAFQAGVRSAGRALFDALGARDENVRTLAGMFLVQSGRRALPILREALARGERVPEVLTMMGDIADPACEEEIARYLGSEDPAVARAAKDALAALKLNQ
jgi:HEAT repeat protein